MSIKNLDKELDELMVVVQVKNNRRNIIRRGFGIMSNPEKNAFLDEFHWGIIKTINPLNYAE